MVRAEGEAVQRPQERSLEGERRRVTLAEHAYATLEEEIVTLRRAPGSVLSEGRLAGELDIGRTPVREALQRLAAEGLVTILPQRGILVSQIDQRSYLGLIEARRPLERTLADLAARRATLEERARFAELAARFREAAREGDLEGFMGHDRDFNQLLKQAARSEFCTKMMGLIQGLSRRFFFRFRAIARLDETAALHADMAAAVADGDGGAAAAACDQLMDHNERFAVESLRSD